MEVTTVAPMNDYRDGGYDSSAYERLIGRVFPQRRLQKKPLARTRRIGQKNSCGRVWGPRIRRGATKNGEKPGEKNVWESQDCATNFVFFFHIFF